MNIITTDQRIKAMDDSVVIINKLVSLPNLTNDQKGRIDANVKHLELMLTLDEIKNHPSDKSGFVTAINAGKAKIA